jgi:hypothetical protein
MAPTDNGDDPRYQVNAKRCRFRRMGLKVRKQALINDLKLPMNPPAKDIYRPTIGIVAGVGDELIIEGEVR